MTSRLIHPLGNRDVKLVPLLLSGLMPPIWAGRLGVPGTQPVSVLELRRSRRKRVGGLLYSIDPFGVRQRRVVDVRHGRFSGQFI